MNWDETLFVAINSLAGKSDFFDSLFAGLASDYFMIVCMCLILVGMWFGPKEVSVRKARQRTVVHAVLAMLIASLLVSASNVLFVRWELLPGSFISEWCNRVRPFDEFSGVPVTLLFYRPHDPTFPSNFAGVVFGMAFAVFMDDKKRGGVLLFMAFVGCFARVFVGIHFPFDILGGMIAALIAAYLVRLIGFIVKPFVNKCFGLVKKLFLAD